MAKDNETSMPSSQGGLVQYHDSDEGIDVDPKTVITLGIMVALVTLTLHSGFLF